MLAVGLRIAMSCALIVAPFFPPQGYVGDGFYVMYAVFSWVIVVSGVVYWYLWTIGVPGWRGTKLEEEIDVLADGTTITRLRYKS